MSANYVGHVSQANLMWKSWNRDFVAKRKVEDNVCVCFMPPVGCSNRGSEIDVGLRRTASRILQQNGRPFFRSEADSKSIRIAI
jgi:hypothetical protein